MYLLQSNPTLGEVVESVDKLSEIQSTYGTTSLNSAVFILIGISVVLVILFAFVFLLKYTLNQQKMFSDKFMSNNDALNKFTESFTKNMEVMGEVKDFLVGIKDLQEDKAKKEVNSEQVYTILKWSLEQAKRKIDIDTHDIIKQNNLYDVKKTEEKIENMVSNVHISLMQGLNRFEKDGKELGNYILHSDFLKQKRDLILQYIYPPDNKIKERDRSKFNRDLDLLFETFQSRIKNKLQK